MKKKVQHFIMLLVILSTLSLTASAQLKPIVFGDSVLCPNAGSVLHTQKIYDTYQWYVRDYFSDEKVLIPGATTNELAIDNDDILKYFSVEISLRNIKRSSDEKLIDGLVFIPPSVKSGGEFKNGPGFFVLNEGDTGVFTLLQPYNTNITWYKNGQPIEGATTNKLLVTTAGTYTVKGAPAACPGYIQNLGLDLVVKLRKSSNPLPVITGDTLLCPDSKGTLATQEGYDSYQWYKRFFGTNKKKAVAGATSNTLMVSASNDAPAYFSVEVTKNSDTLTSAETLVDSYAFLPPAVISDGDFINGPGYFILNKGDTGRFTLTQPYDTNITWYRNNKEIPGEKGVSLHVTTGGNYFVQGAPSVCPDFIQNPGVVLSVKLITGGSVKASASADVSKTTVSSNALKLYPNPAKDFATLDVSAFAGKDITISIAARDGKIVFAKQYSNVGSAIKIDLAGYQQGVYYVKAGNEVLKLVVTK
jgi:hypothetical protein